jgi:hypothetical protein
VWFWLLISVAADLFRRYDISGWIKAIWVIAWIVVPYIGVLAYLIFQGRGMAERNVQQAQQARDELRRVVGFSAADEIEKLDRLKKAGSISDAEFIALVTPWPTLAPVADRLFLFTPDEGGQIEPAADEVIE